MEITIKSDYMNENDIKFLLHLLPKRMRYLPAHVFICDQWQDVRDLVYYENTLYWERVEKGVIGGSYLIHRGDDVIVYPSLFEKDEIFLINIAFNLFHELRHVYQRHEMSDIFAFENETYSSNTTEDGYMEQWIEQDANHFAFQLITLNQESISEYINFNNWHVSERIPAPRHHLTISQELVV